MAVKDNPQQIIYQSWIHYWTYIFLLILVPIVSINLIIFLTAVYNLSVILSIVIFVISLIISLGIYIYIWINRSSHKLYVYKDKIIYETGFLNKKYKEIKKKDIRTIEVDQPFIQRILNIGTLKFATAATTGYEIIFEGVKYPKKIKKEIEKSAKELKKEEEKKKLEKEKPRKRVLKKTLRKAVIKKRKKKKEDEEEGEEEKNQVKIYLKVYRTRY